MERTLTMLFRLKELRQPAIRACWQNPTECWFVEPPVSAEARAVAMVYTPETLRLASFSLVPALLAQLMTNWSLSKAQGGWLASIMSGGYMLTVLPLVVLTDRVPARSVFLASSALGALSCFGIALSNTFLAALGWRAVSGSAMPSTTRNPR